MEQSERDIHEERFKEALRQLNIPINGIEEVIAETLEAGLQYQSRYEITQALGFIMSEASECHVSASWFGDWALVINEAFAKNDTAWLEQRLVTAMKALHDYLGHWADFDTLLDGAGAVYIPYVPD